jgi:glutathione S-transferase
MKFYYHPVSSYSQKVQIALIELDVRYTPMLTALFQPEVRAQYRALYPFGKVPLLVLDDGTQIGESTIIIEHLDQGAGGGRLIAAEHPAALRTRALDRICDLYVNDQVVTILFDSWKPADKREPERVVGAQQLLAAACTYLERELEGRQWLAGDRFSMADCAAAPALNYLRKLPAWNPELYPRLQAYAERLCARPSFARVLEEAQPHLQALLAAKAG